MLEKLVMHRGDFFVKNLVTSVEQLSTVLAPYLSGQKGFRNTLERQVGGELAKEIRRDKEEKLAANDVRKYNEM